jgi:peptidoglycan/xylan/chitin deacetylase (PgdA/CDA1 family)
MRRFLTTLAALSVFTGLPDALAGDKRIALTFDDAPRPADSILTPGERTALLLQELERAETGPVAIFVTTKGFGKHDGGRDRIADYAEAGHLIANHSHNHDWLHKTDLSTYLADLDRAEDELVGFDNRRAWFRFPFLDEGRGDVEKRDAMRAALDERGLMSGYVTVDTYDWHLNSRLNEAVAEGRSVDHDAVREVYVAMIVDAAEHYAAFSERWLDRQPAHVLLLHENDVAALYIGDAVQALRAKGWEIISPDEAYRDPIAEEAPKTTFSGMGRVSAMGFDRGARGAEAFDHWSASEAGIDRKLEEAGAFTN